MSGHLVWQHLKAWSWRTVKLNTILQCILSTNLTITLNNDLKKNQNDIILTRKGLSIHVTRWFITNTNIKMPSFFFLFFLNIIIITLGDYWDLLKELKNDLMVQYIDMFLSFDFSICCWHMRSVVYVVFYITHHLLSINFTIKSYNLNWDHKFLLIFTSLHSTCMHTFLF